MQQIQSSAAVEKATPAAFQPAKILLACKLAWKGGAQGRSHPPRINDFLLLQVKSLKKPRSSPKPSTQPETRLISQHSRITVTLQKTGKATDHSCMPATLSAETQQLLRFLGFTCPAGRAKHSQPRKGQAKLRRGWQDTGSTGVPKRLVSTWEEAVSSLCPHFYRVGTASWSSWMP